MVYLLIIYTSARTVWGLIVHVGTLKPTEYSFLILVA